ASPPTESFPLSLHDALPISARAFRTLQRQLRHRARRIAELLRLRATQRMLDRPMHQQVRIAPDRRGEVRVRLQREAEVADVLRRSEEHTSELQSRENLVCRL